MSFNVPGTAITPQAITKLPVNKAQRASSRAIARWLNGVLPALFIAPDSAPRD